MKVTRNNAMTVGFFLLYGQFGCGAGKVACQIIHAADKVCTVIEVVGADGKPQQIPVTQQELQGFGLQAAAHREAEKKAGVPIGTPIPEK